jgi:hypothetical protein
VAGLVLAGPVLRLGLVGGGAWAERVAVVISGDGDDRTVLADADIRALIQRHRTDRNRDARLWPVHRLRIGDRTWDSRSTTGYRIPLGNQALDVVPIRDRDGLPVRIWLWYDRADPTRTAEPLAWNTWFVPGILLTFGAMAAVVGVLLWRRAGTPIPEPDQAPTETAPTLPAHSH